MVAKNNQQNTSKLDVFYSSKLAIKAKEFLNSKYNLALICLFIGLFWALNIGFACIPFMAIEFVSTLIFCHDNPKAILLPVISISLMFNNLSDSMTLVICCVGAAVIALAVFVICKVFIQRVQIKKGKLFWPYVLVLLANALAGIIGHFELKAFFITLALGLLLYFLYWFSINFIKNYKEYFAWCLIFMSFIITFELVVAYMRMPDIFEAFKTKAVRIGTGEINSHALFLVSGIISSYYLATKSEKTKNKILFVLLALFQDVIVFFTFSRLSLLAAAFINLIFIIILFKNSKYKKKLLIVAGSVLCVGLLVCIVFFNKISGVLGFYLKTGFGLNGRGDLWPWCIEIFKQNPIFGFGFITRDFSVIEGSTITINSTGTYAQIMAHNTIMHYLVCTGIVGLILNIPFYVQKFRLLCQRPFSQRIFCFLNILVFELVSLMDASCAHLFNLILVYLILGLNESEGNVENCEQISVGEIKVDNDEQQLEAKKQDKLETKKQYKKIKA